MSDPNSIQACKDLVEYGIGSEFESADATLISPDPEKVVEYGTIALWAQYQGRGTKQVNLRMPAILAWFKTLAGSGVGPTGEFGGVKYKFIHSMFCV